MFSIFDFFVFYLQSIPLNNTDVEINNSISIYQVPIGNISFGDKVTFHCNFSQHVSQKVYFEWDLHLSNSDVVSLAKKTNTSQKLEIIFNQTTDPEVESISCKTTTKFGAVIAESSYPLTFLDPNLPISPEVNQPNSNCGAENDAEKNVPDIIKLASPVNISAAYIEGRSVVLSWKSPEMDNLSSESQVLEYVVEYKKTILDWRDGIEKVKIPVTQLSAHVKNLMPWTTYHFRVVAIYSTGQSAPSYPIVVLTPEEVPSGKPQHVKVKVLDDHTLQISWKPAPRNTWNGAILGYNIGSKKASSSDEESYTFHVLTARELLGRPCIHQISVPDSSIPYKIVVQAFNNIGSGPLSLEAITETS